MRRNRRRLARFSEFLANDQVTTAQYLLEGPGAAPVAGEPQAAILVPNCDPDRVARPGLTIVRHSDLKRRVAIDRDRRQRVGDVLDARLPVECRLRWAG